MGDFYIKKDKVSYKLDDGKELIDTYNKEKDKELKKNLDQIEETLNYKKNYVPYDFSFVDMTFDEDFTSKLKEDITSYLINVIKKNKDLPNPFVLGINKASKFKDKWFIYDEKGNNKPIDEIKVTPFCGRIDYLKDSNKVYLQYIKEEKGKVVKEEFKLVNDIIQDEVLKEYLK